MVGGSLDTLHGRRCIVHGERVTGGRECVGMWNNFAGHVWNVSLGGSWKVYTPTPNYILYMWISGEIQ